MNEENPALTSSPAPAQPAPTMPPQSPSPRTGSAGGLAVLLAIVAIGGAGVAAWQSWQVRGQVTELREELARRLSEGEGAATEARIVARQQQEALSSLQGKLGAIEAKVEATEGQAEALEALYQEFLRSREDRVLAEVEQAVTIAAQQLRLAGNLEAALIALQGAEARLAIHDKGQFAPLRRAVANDIERLKSQPDVDTTGLALRLERLLERTDALPLAFESQLPEGTPEPAASTAAAAPAEAGAGAAVLDFVTRLARDVWAEVRTLVRVERLDQSDPVLLAPSQNAFLRENLKIRLLTARLALLSHDGRTYAADLAQARSWVERFFDGRDERVRAALEELTALAAVPVGAERPALTETFAALRLIKAAHPGERVPALPDAAPDTGAAAQRSNGTGAPAGSRR